MNLQDSSTIEILRMGSAVKSFTRVNEQPLGRNQRGINVIGLIIWIVLAVIIMGGVTALFQATSQQTAIGAEQNQQQQSILNALNRISRDVSNSERIVYAGEKEIVIDVTVGPEDAKVVERRRYFLNDADKKVYEYSKVIKRGELYSVSTATTDWEQPTIQRKATTVVNVDTSVPLPFLRYWKSDDATTPLSTPRFESKDTELIARVDINLTAKVANKGNVALGTSAVPRSTTNLGGLIDSGTLTATCPAFTATREGNNVVLRWDKAEGAEKYEVTRNGMTLSTINNDPNLAKYSYSDAPGTSAVVMNYMLKVHTATTIANCIDSVTPIIITPGATQLTSDLVPLTTKDGSGDPVSTAWSNAGQTTKVELKWQKVDIASGYVIYKQRLDNSGAPQGQRVTVATLEEYPYVDKSNSEKAATTLSYQADAGWDEHWEWSIKILSRTGDNDQTPETRTLSYPNPVTNASISALPVAQGAAGRVSDSDLAAGFGNTRITWTYTAGMEARGFDIYRSAIDAPATNFPAGFTKIGTANIGETEFFDRRSELGSTYGYYVVAKNKSGFSNSYASRRVQQLQYPADPAIAPVSLNGSRDMTDGTNRVMWSAVKSASGYHVERLRNDVTNDTPVCLSGTNCSTNSGTVNASTTELIDSNSVIQPATRFRYGVYAYNATGLSPQTVTKVTLTQRPTAPALRTTANPTLNSTWASMAWNHTAGAWCSPGAYTGASNSSTCQYRQTQYNNNGSFLTQDSFYSLSYNWGNQDWGRKYHYDVQARNAAISNGGWSDPSGRVTFDTYPADFAVGIWNGDQTGYNAQRVNYDSAIGYGGWGDVRQAGYTTVAIGDARGTREISMVRVHDGWQATSGDGSLLLPPWDIPAGNWGDNDGTKIGARTWSLIAAPGTTYRYDLTAKSLENELTRSKSTANTTTPADIPMRGAVAVVCSGPGNGDGTGYQPHPGQIISGRVDYSDLRARYGWYDKTAVQKLYGGSPQSYWGVGWHDVDRSGNGNGITATGGNGYFRNITNGFNFTNVAYGRTDSATLSGFINNSIYTYDGCAPSGAPMQEPGDACYVATYAGCTALNPDQRPKWLSR